MELAIRERAIRTKGAPRNLPAPDPLPGFSLLLRELFSIAENHSRRRAALKERTTQTIYDPEGLAGRPVMMTGAPQLKPYDAPRAATRSLVGKTVSHYRIIAKLGCGGMGVVYRAKDLRLHRNVALKFSTNDMLAEPDAANWILREARAGSLVSHPNVCAVYDIGEFQGLPFLVMELLEGQTLKQRIKQPLTLGKFLHLAIQLSDGLDAVHARGVVHRDIKPSNIFVTPTDQAKIFDFGLAMTSHAGVSHHPRRRDRVRPRLRPDPGNFRGTPVYMSPEHILGEPLDSRTDLFSLGVVFREMLTGKSFSICQLPRDLPVAVAQLVEKALERDRQYRCQSAAEICAELKRIQRDLRLEV